VKWLEDELELNALHNPGSRQGSGNEKAALAQRTALSAALGGRVDVTSMTTISGGLHFLFFLFSINCQYLQFATEVLPFFLGTYQFRYLYNPPLRCFADWKPFTVKSRYILNALLSFNS
jgi:hypothetical protein